MTLETPVAELKKYDALWYTYTSHIDDTRLPAFIEALTQSKPVSFQGKIYTIQRILMCVEKTIVVLKVFR